jgi:ribosomal protein L37E
VSTDSRRFSDRGDPLRYLRPDQVLVRCPRCGDRAVVNQRKVSCGSCGYARVSASGWFGPAQLHASGSCTRCSQMIERRQPAAPGRAAKKLPVTCPACGAVRTLPAHLDLRCEGGTATYHGLPLWLRTDYRGEVLWAYDEAHLDFLERYIRALIRERIPNCNASLASRLPAWLKNAKNRDGLLTALAGLRATLKSHADGPMPRSSKGGLDRYSALG